ncbi:MAG: protease modulator HflC [Rhodospirillaceae bacterium]|nr:protease modulator HflC [Rhodospirillaceae bacterium]
MSRVTVAALVAGAIVVLIVVLSSTFTVNQAQQALVLQLGEPRRIVSEPGLHFKLPLVQQVLSFDKRVLDFGAEKQEIPTLDQKQLVVDAFAKFRIVDTLKFYQSVRDVRTVKDRLAAIISSKLREAFGGIPMQQILTEKRAELMAQITQRVREEAKSFGIEVMDVRVKRVDLPPQNSEAVYGQMKTQREQEARRIRAEGDREAQTLRAEADKEKTVIIANAQRQAEILRGEGDAEATRIYNEAYARDPKFFDFFRTMQAYRKALPRDTTTYVGPPLGDFFRYFGTPGELQLAPSTRATEPIPGGPGQTSSAGNPPAGGLATGLAPPPVPAAVEP